MKLNKGALDKMKWLRKSITDLFNKGIPYRYSDAETIAEIGKIVKTINTDFCNFHKKTIECEKNPIGDYKSIIRLFGVHKEVDSIINGHEVLICEMKDNWQTSTLFWRGKPIVPYKIDLGFIGSQNEVILSFLHEIGHILTHEFVKETHDETIMDKWDCKKFIDEIVAWKKAIELIEALNIDINEVQIRKHSSNCLMSYFDKLFPDSPKILGSYLISFYLKDSIDTMKSQSCPKSKRDSI